MTLPTAAFEAGRYVGSIVYVEPAVVKLNLPHGTTSVAPSYSGHRVGRGEVGEFVVIEGETQGILGRITQIRLLDGDRLTVEPARKSEAVTANPIGTVQLLLSIDLATGKISRGILEHPRIGQYAYAAHPDLVKHAVEQNGGEAARFVELAHLPQSPTTRISFPPDAIFGRHCAVLGTTGGGKSWTLARLLGEIACHRGKAILFDPSGEFRTLNERAGHVWLGGQPATADDRRFFVGFPHKHLSESDLFAMFQPSGGSQSPKLREALQSLKLLHLAPELGTDGLLIKAQQAKAPVVNKQREHAAAIREPGAAYDITKLADQIYEECVFPTGGFQNNPNPASWGGADVNGRGYCTTLVSRISVLVHSAEMAPVFAPGALADLTVVIQQFLADDRYSILRVSMEDLPFEHHTRELVANALGHHLIKLARRGAFKDKPLIVALDEAHQFLNKSIGDEFNRVRLESFGLIAKEGRKYGLHALLATQRPRDIPEDVLSQMGMFIVHRLINEKDRQIVEQACGSLDASAASFLPILGQGEALVIGLDTPMTMPVQILHPVNPPDSTPAAIWR